MTLNYPKSGKAAQIFQNLQLIRGVDIPELCKRTGWQAHSVRAALSKLRKVGHRIDRIETKTKGKPARYKLATDSINK
jgi:DNA-binding transcriptional regulator PaaX